METVKLAKTPEDPGGIVAVDDHGARPRAGEGDVGLDVEVTPNLAAA
jgi:hypothetical protein